MLNNACLMIAIILIFFSKTSYAAGFDPYNMRNYMTNARNAKVVIHQLQEARKQYEVMQNNVELAKKNMKSLNPSKIRDLKNALKAMRSKLKDIDSLSGQLADLDKDYNDYFAIPGDNPRPTDVENALMQHRVKTVLKSNQRAINSVTVLETYAQNEAQINNILSDSGNAAGAMQAVQSTNNLLAIMARNEDDLKLMMGRDLEQRTLILTQEQLDRDYAYNVNQQFINGSKYIDPNEQRVMPNLKKGAGRG